ncbi:MAG: UbiA-like polyprenyltransferase [Gemmatimonas sp.]
MSNIAPPPGARDGQRMQGFSLPIRLANFVKLPHTVFALPFALIGVLIASAHHRVTVPMVGWIVLAFTAARFAAMGFNRIVDREVDAVNPRTAMRELPRGTLSVAQARLSVVFAGLVFVFASSRLNPLCLLLSPVALLWTLGYSYTKRFTRWSHLWLGLGLSIAPVGGYLAVTGAWSDPWWMLGVLALAVVTWTGGFDILYALQDAEFDRTHGLHSVPSAMGVSRAISLSRVLHAITVACLGLLVLADPFGLDGMADRAGPIAGRVDGILWLGVALVAVLLVWEHRLVKPTDLSKVDAAFFTMNGIISIGFLLVVAAARFVANGLLA